MWSILMAIMLMWRLSGVTHIGGIGITTHGVGTEVGVGMWDGAQVAGTSALAGDGMTHGIIIITILIILLIGDIIITPITARISVEDM